MATMTKEKEEYVKGVAAVIWGQLLSTIDNNVLGSWGVDSLAYTLFEAEGEQFPALTFTVDGILFRGRIFIALDEGADYYQIYCLKDGIITLISSDVCFDEMGEIIDRFVERGTCSQEEYNQKVDAEISRVLSC